MIAKKLKSHLFLEFKKTLISNDSLNFLKENKQILLEKHGIIPNLDAYWKALYDELETMKPNKNGDFIINSNIFYDIENCPFYGVYIKIHLNESNDKPNSNGYYYPSTLNTLKNSDDKIFLKIYIEVEGTNFNFLAPLRRTFSHELTHAYEDYMRIKNNAHNLNHIISNTNYRKVNSINTYLLDVRNVITSVIYFFSEMEANALIPSIRGEILPYIKKCSNMNDVFNILKKNTRYSYIKRVEKKLIGLIEGADENTLKIWNEITEDNIQSVNGLKRILKYRYLKIANHITTQLSKMLYDLYMDYGKKNMIPDKF